MHQSSLRQSAAFEITDACLKMKDKTRHSVRQSQPHEKKSGDRAEGDGHPRSVKAILFKYLA